MTNINVVCLDGRLVRDAEIVANASVGIIKFTVASNYSIKRGNEWAEEVNFIDCTMFGNRAIAIRQYLTKCTAVVVSGSLRQNRWQDKNTGENKSKVEIIVNDITWSSSKDNAIPTTVKETQFPTNEDFESIPF